MEQKWKLKKWAKAGDRFGNMRVMSDGLIVHSGEYELFIYIPDHAKLMDWIWSSKGNNYEIAPLPIQWGETNTIRTFHKQCIDVIKMSMRPDDYYDGLLIKNPIALYMRNHKLEPRGK